MPVKLILLNSEYLMKHYRRNSWRMSFPRKRESTPFTGDFWTPAFAGVTVQVLYCPFKHRYDGLDRPTLAEYSINDSNEAFTMDNLGNRDSVIIRDGHNVDHMIDNLTKRHNTGEFGRCLSEDRRKNGRNSQDSKP